MAIGDSLTMTYVEVDGVVRNEKTTKFATIIPERPITVDRVVMVETYIKDAYVVGALLVERRR